MAAVVFAANLLAARRFLLDSWLVVAARVFATVTVAAVRLGRFAIRAVATLRRAVDLPAGSNRHLKKVAWNQGRLAGVTVSRASRSIRIAPLKDSASAPMNGFGRVSWLRPQRLWLALRTRLLPRLDRLVPCGVMDEVLLRNLRRRLAVRLVEHLRSSSRPRSHSVTASAAAGADRPLSSDAFPNTPSPSPRTSPNVPAWAFQLAVYFVASSGARITSRFSALFSSAALVKLKTAGDDRLRRRSP